MIDNSVRLHSAEDFEQGVVALISRLAKRARLCPRQAYRLRLAAEEITTNIAMHGYRGGDGVIYVDGGLDADWVWLRIEDEAPDFDPREHDSAARVGADPGQAPIGGFGLLLALRSVDRFDHEHLNGRNRNTLLIRRSPAPCAADGETGGTDGQDERAGGR